MGRMRQRVGCLPLSLFGEERQGWASAPAKVSVPKAAPGPGRGPGSRCLECPHPNTLCLRCLPFILGVVLGRAGVLGGGGGGHC